MTKKLEFVNYQTWIGIQLLLSRHSWQVTCCKLRVDIYIYIYIKVTCNEFDSCIIFCSLQPNENVDYLENNCLSFDSSNDKIHEHGGGGSFYDNNIGIYSNKKRKKQNLELSCNFKATKGRILKTVDSVFQNITSSEECRLKCVEANFRYCTYLYLSIFVHILTES